jgi:transcriptional regulator with GAF, ATPase, and Fis domain
MDELVAKSPAMQQVVREVAIVAPTDTTVLIQGESGTGKELIARAIHERSARREGPFVAVNCAAVPRELYESEFFGHARGAFSGALRDRVGRFEAAEGGTLFLDEIGETPLELQGKLLRVLQERTFERVGEARPRKADVRILTATNRDLAGEVAAGRFRQDLYYRLNVFPIRVRPLRERKEDIGALAEALLEEIARQVRLPRVSLTPSLLAALEGHDWPGNVRELRNVLERAVISSGFGEVSLPASSRTTPSVLAKPADAPPPSAPGPASSGQTSIVSDEEMRRRERENIELALEQCGGRIYGPQGAAAILGLKPTTLASRIAKMNLRQAGGRRRGSG